MIVYLKSGKDLRERLKPDVDYYTRRVETEEGKNIREIVTGLGIDPGLIAFIYTEGQVKGLDYVPGDGQHITLQSPVSGG
jgi:hypothetical protein